MQCTTPPATQTTFGDGWTKMMPPDAVNHLLRREIEAGVIAPLVAAAEPPPVLVTPAPPQRTPPQPPSKSPAPPQDSRDPGTLAAKLQQARDDLEMKTARLEEARKKASAKRREADTAQDELIVATTDYAFAEQRVKELQAVSGAPQVPSP